MKTKTTLGKGRSFALSQLALGVGLAWSGVCAAQSEPVLMAAADVASSGEMKTVVVSASRVEEDADKVTGTVTVKTDKDLNRKKVNSLKDALDDEVGVSVRQQAYRSQFAQSGAGRAGNEGVNIRGLEGDQVMLLVDGVGLPSSYNFGSVAIGRGDYIDLEGYKRVEIVRGATSTQYGSSGLAGSVMFVTKEPEDYLKDGKTQHFGVKTGYSSADKSFLFSPTYAFEAGDTKGLVVVSQRRGEETDNMGSNSSKSTSRTEANPQSNRSDYIMGKLKQRINGSNALKLTLESIRRETNSDNLNQVTATNYSDTSRDTVTRTMAKLDWQFTPARAFFDKLDVSVNAQTSQVEQQAWQNRAAAPQNRTRDTFYNENGWGSSAQFESNFGKDVQHRLIYGADARATSYAMLGYRSESAPVAYFPNTDGKNYGAFVQDDISIGAVKVTPGLRYDRYSFTPKATNTGYAATYEELSDGAFSPKLGVSWDVKPELTLYSLYTHGFRAPQVGQINGSFSNTAGGTTYQYIGNSSLKSEQSDSIELGTRGKTDALKYSVATFYGKYKDFIADSVSIGACNGVQTCYQAQNLQSVTLMGLELRGDWALNNQWRTTAAYAHILGTSENNGVKDYVATVDPDKLVATLQYSPSATWGTVGRMTAVDRKAGEPSGTLVAPGGYTVFDMTAWYQLNKSTSINAGLYNIFDKKYVRWSDVRGLSTAALAATVDASTQPGRNFAINLIHNF